MGRASRPKPDKLAEKLKQIRLSLNLSQTDMLVKLGYSSEKKDFRSIISAYELGKREPTLIDLLKYARLAKASVEVLIDDEIDLSDHIPVWKK
jgi:transcriptional regulator with XRE-family HTH domain